MARYQITNLDTNLSVETEIPGALRPAAILPVPYVSQLEAGATTHNNDCGAACGTMLLHAYGLAPQITVDQFYDLTGTVGDAYLSVGQIQNVLQNHGLRTEWRTGLALNDILTYMAADKPMMVLFKYGVLVNAKLTEKKGFKGPHFALVVGLDAKNLYIHDPYYTATGGEARAYPIPVFMEAWEAVGEKGENPIRGGMAPLISLGEPATPEPVLFNIRVTNTEWLNVRTGPGKNFPDIGDLKFNEVVPAYEEKFGWARIGIGRWACMGPGLSEKIPV